MHSSELRCCGPLSSLAFDGLSANDVRPDRIGNGQRASRRTFNRAYNQRRHRSLRYGRGRQNAHRINSHYFVGLFGVIIAFAGTVTYQIANIFIAIMSL